MIIPSATTKPSARVLPSNSSGRASFVLGEADMANVTLSPTLGSFPINGTNRVPTMSNQAPRRPRKITALRVEKPLEELYNVRVERKVSPERLVALGVSRWSIWKTGKCRLPWDWQVDQLVYIEEGEVRVVPDGSQRYMRFVAGDLVRYPKWFEADLWFNGFYQERYSFRVYGDDY
ncbi:hypothetical protein Nepgr_014422 [Nepenthes gracilis]|uniref:(S)-ureidoglycine aminohydrolase cupin domain-containing protein n=1 Tax=Nepenthes gracilis TaxID=150966 RepID=A0AAD3SLU0_NEPGR|nr:hypothetical protein Nepgr_014422 [Nepenthes gracilis]